MLAISTVFDGSSPQRRALTKHSTPRCASSASSAVHLNLSPNGTFGKSCLTGGCRGPIWCWFIHIAWDTMGFCMGIWDIFINFRYVISQIQWDIFINFLVFWHAWHGNYKANKKWGSYPTKIPISWFKPHTCWHKQKKTSLPSGVINHGNWKSTMNEGFKGNIIMDSLKEPPKNKKYSLLGGSSHLVSGL